MVTLTLLFQAFDNAAGELFFCPKVVDNQRLVGAQHLHDFFRGSTRDSIA
jgi:hypothetical protein